MWSDTSQRPAGPFQGCVTEGVTHYLPGTAAMAMLAVSRSAARVVWRLAVTLRRARGALNGMRGDVEGRSWRDRLPHVLSDLGVALVVAGSEGAVVVNEAFRAITGYSTDEALALRPFGEIIAREPPEAFAQDPPGPVRYETEVLRKDGRRIPVAVSAQVAWYEGRREVVATFRDLTDHRRAESELTVRA